MPVSTHRARVAASISPRSKLRHLGISPKKGTVENRMRRPQRHLAVQIGKEDVCPRRAHNPCHCSRSHVSDFEFLSSSVYTTPCRTGSRPPSFLHTLPKGSAAGCLPVSSISLSLAGLAFPSACFYSTRWLPQSHSRPAARGSSSQ